MKNAQYLKQLKKKTEKRKRGAEGNAKSETESTSHVKVRPLGLLGETRGKGAPRVTPRAKLNPPVMSKFDLLACLARLEEKGRRG